MTIDELLPVWQDKITQHSTYFGIPTMKCPTDAWVYQEIVNEIRPDVIIEIGTWHGGSALMLAHLCDALSHGHVYSIDKNPPPKFAHPRISWVTGDATEWTFGDMGKTLVIEDSSHDYDSTLKILQRYAPLISKGSYLICEDTICHHGLNAGPNPGPYEATKEFLKNNKDFEVDRTREPYGISWNPEGYLRRIK